jgi:hypothetical protein
MTTYFLAGAMTFAMMTGVALAQSGTSAVPPHKTHHGLYDAGDRYTDALNTLNSHGFLHVTDLADDGSGFTAMAWYDGSKVSVRIDPSTGAIEVRG